MNQAPTAQHGVELDKLAEDYFAGWAARDVERILALHTEDTRFEIHAGGGPSVGLPAVREAFSQLFAQWPGFRFESHRVLFGELHWVLDWTLIADLPHGEVRFGCLDVVEVSPEGRVARKDTYVDIAELNAALGRS